MTAQILLKVPEPIAESICFHCQQSVEKFLKAFLFSNNVSVRKTHNIYELLSTCILLDNTFETLKEAKIDILTLYAVDIRYPDDLYIPTLEEAKEALRLAELTRKFVIEKLKEHGFNF